MRKCIYLCFLLFLPLLSSCGILRKTKVIVKTETIIHVDTLIKVRVDSVPKIVKVYLHDTAFVENEYAKAKSYYDSTMKKIVLSLQSKPFEVNVKITKKETTSTTTKTSERKVPLWYFAFIIIAMIFVFLYLLKNKK